MLWQGCDSALSVAQPQIIQQSGESQGLVQLRRSVDRRRDGRHRRPGLADCETTSQILLTRAAVDRRYAQARLCHGRFAGEFRLEPASELPVKPLYERLKASQVLVRYMNYAGWGDGCGSRSAATTRSTPA